MAGSLYFYFASIDLTLNLSVSFYSVNPEAATGKLAKVQLSYLTRGPTDKQTDEPSD